jgi:hypothetical protein
MMGHARLRGGTAGSENRNALLSELGTVRTMSDSLKTPMPVNVLRE